MTELASGRAEAGTQVCHSRALSTEITFRAFCLFVLCFEATWGPGVWGLPKQPASCTCCWSAEQDGHEPSCVYPAPAQPRLLLGSPACLPGCHQLPAWPSMAISTWLAATGSQTGSSGTHTRMALKDEVVATPGCPRKHPTRVLLQVSMLPQTCCVAWSRSAPLWTLFPAHTAPGARTLLSHSSRRC